MRLSLHKKPKFLPSTIARARESLPPQDARSSRWLLVVVIALLSATVAFAAKRISGGTSDDADERREHATSGALSMRADDGTRALLDERIHAHLKAQQTR